MSRDLIDGFLHGESVVGSVVTAGARARGGQEERKGSRVDDVPPARSVASDGQRGSARQASSQKSIVWVNAMRCRMWEKHDRLEEAVSESSCKEEIESVRAHGQIVPALARRIQGTPGYDLELIYGSRRLFIARYLNVPLLVEIRPLSDLEAAVCMDIENRHRKDISAYERGVSYERWLRAGLFRNQDELARSLKVSASQVSRLLKLARIPSVVVSAFDCPTQICETWADDLWAAWNDPQRRRVIVARARNIASEAERPSAKVVFERLTEKLARERLGKRSGASDARSVEVVCADNGGALFRVQYLRKVVTLSIPSNMLSRDSLSKLKKSLADMLQSATNRSTSDATEDIMPREPARPQIYEAIRQQDRTGCSPEIGA
jgi:ParB family chromosome partitioning protein